MSERLRLLGRLGLFALSALLLAGCVGAGFLIGGGTPAPEVTTREQAAQLVLAQDPRFAGLERRDPDLIGQGSWWDASETAEGFDVTVQIGWGDCPAGCINHHTWVYSVSRTGTVTLESEVGDALPGGGQGNVGGHAVAGPVCPVERFPPDPGCAPRPVAGAVLVVRDGAGNDVATVTTDDEGAFSLTLPPGEYQLLAQPVEGLMGTPEAISFDVQAGSPVELTVAYDTGIR